VPTVARGSRGRPTVLVIDDAERLPRATVGTTLHYLVLNAPANLRLVIGSRTRLPVSIAEFVAKGHVAVLGVNDLRLQLDESMDMIQKRLGDRLGLDDRARLHADTEGWPLGLQLALATIEREPDAHAAMASLGGRSGSLQDYFVESLAARLSPEIQAGLVRASILERFDTPLFEAVSGIRNAGPLLEELARATPLLMAAENSAWMRMHTLARDFLLGRFERLPEGEQARVHGIAAHWFSEHERFPEAAHHALAAGDETMAPALAARSLWDLSTNGKVAEAREFLDRLPRAMWERDRELRMIVASVLAFGDRNEEAIVIAKDVLDDPQATKNETFAALRVAGGCVGITDRVGELVPLLDRWQIIGDFDPIPLFRIAKLNAQAFMALQRGDTATARALISQQAVFGDVGPHKYAAGLGRSVLGLSHLWDGQPRLAVEALRQPLRDVERDGRRGAIACLLASIVAAALFESGDIAGARAMLADRLDIIERAGFPDHLVCAYRTLAGIAFAEGDHARGLLVLAEFDALGKRRDMPRLRVLALADIARAHAERGRFESASRALADMDALLPLFDDPKFEPLREGARLAAAIAHASVELLRRRVQDAVPWLEVADRLASALRREADLQRVQAMRGLVAATQGDAQAVSLMHEAIELATLGGRARLSAEARPLVAALVGDVTVTLVDKAAEDAASSRLLTAKEGRVLRLLDQGLSNKSIARELDVSGETVKWHLKNLFAKLSATTRTQAVSRARTLGLLGH